MPPGELQQDALATSGKPGCAGLSSMSLRDMPCVAET